MKAKKDDITHKLKIARGQIDGILQMIEEDRYCVDTVSYTHLDVYKRQRVSRCFCFRVIS